MDALQQIAPLQLAEEWDNVGLLVPSTKRKRIKHLFLTIDLTPSVFDEALASKADMIIAYHPPIFTPLKRFDPDSLVLRAIENNMLIYSPHTALDAAPAGLCDFLASTLGPLQSSMPIIHASSSSNEYKIVIFVPNSHLDALRTALSAQARCGIIGAYSHCSFNIPGQGTFRGDATTNPVVGKKQQLEFVTETRLEMICPKSSIPLAAQVIQQHHPYEEPAWDIYPLYDKPIHNTGPGRIATLSKPTTLATLTRRIKKALNLKHVRFAPSPPHDSNTNISKVALCPGAGGSLFQNVSDVDLYLTGEMRHHDVLAKNNAGASIILTEHTNCERPYLNILAKRLKASLNNSTKISIAKSDHDPISLA